MELEGFMELSRRLLDDRDLPSEFGAALYHELAAIHGDALAQLLAAKTIDEIVADPALRATASDVVQSWLFGAPFQGGAPQASGGDGAALWFEGRFWRYVRAHAPALSGGYFGHWMYSGEER